MYKPFTVILQIHAFIAERRNDVTNAKRHWSRRPQITCSSSLEFYAYKNYTSTIQLW